MIEAINGNDCESISAVNSATTAISWPLQGGFQASPMLGLGYSGTKFRRQGRNELAREAEPGVCIGVSDAYKWITSQVFPPQPTELLCEIQGLATSPVPGVDT